MSTVLVVGADPALVAGALAGLGDEDLVVLDASAERLEAIEDEVGDPRVWFMIGDADVIPLPDASVDEVVGVGISAEVDRVSR
jgi:ubiquinone/menaquinone biosynthesis C-methylase UbiE